MSKKCPNCGAENRDNAVICTSCYTFFETSAGNSSDNKITQKRSEKFEKIMKDTGDLYKEYVINLKDNVDNEDQTSSEAIKEDIIDEKNDATNPTGENEIENKIDKILEEVKKITPIGNEDQVKEETENIQEENKESDINNEDNNNINKEIEVVKNETENDNIRNIPVQEEADNVVEEVVSAEHNDNISKSDNEKVDINKIVFPEDKKEEKEEEKKEISSSKTLKLKNKEKIVDDSSIEEADKDNEYEDAINVFETLSNKKFKIVAKTDSHTENASEKKAETKHNRELRKSQKINRKQAKSKSVFSIDKVIKNSIIISLCLLLILGAIFFVSKRSQKKNLDEAIVVLNSGNSSSYMEIYNSLVSKGYSSLDIEESLSKSNINFSENALNAAYGCAKDTNKLNNKTDVKSFLESKKFFDNEVNFALQSIQWDKYLKLFVDECILKKKELNKKDIIAMIKEANFSEREIENIETYDAWPKLAEKNVLSYIDEKNVGKSAALEYLLSLEYSPEEIDIVTKEIDWKSIAKKYLSSTLKADVSLEASRNSFKSILESAGFDEEEITAVLDKEDFSSYAKEELYDYISNNEEAINKKEILQKFIDKGFNDKEVNDAMARVDWKSMSLTALKTYDDGTKSMKDLLNKLRELGYSDEEIEHAQTNYNWETHTMYYIKGQIEKGTAGGKNNMIKILNEGGYPLAIINSSIKNFDFNIEALKALTSFLSKTENCSKNKAKEHLESMMYDSAEINYAFDSNTINWVSKAINFLNYVGYDSRVSARNILEAQGYSDAEISAVISSLESSGNWRSQCLIRYNTLLSDKDIAGLCQEHTYYDTRSGGSYSALKGEQFTDEEINYAANQIHWPTNCEISTDPS